MNIFKYIKNLLDSTKKVLRDHAGTTLCVTASVAAAAGAYLLTLPASASVTVVYVLGSIIVVSGGGAVFSIGVLSGRENDSSATKSENSEVENLIQEVASLKATFKVLDGDNKVLNQKLAVALNESLLAKKDVESVRTEQAKMTRTLSETSISFSRLETETKTRFKAQEKVNTDLEDRLTDCEDEIDRLSANNDSEDGLEDNGFFAHPRRRNVVSANEVNFSQASTHRINN